MENKNMKVEFCNDGFIVLNCPESFSITISKFSNGEYKIIENNSINQQPVKKQMAVVKRIGGQTSNVGVIARIYYDCVDHRSLTLKKAYTWCYKANSWFVRQVETTCTMPLEKAQFLCKEFNNRGWKCVVELVN